MAKKNKFARAKVSKTKAKEKVQMQEAVEDRAPTVPAVRKMEVMDELHILVPGEGERYGETIFPGAW
jgi:hypothetical protein